jgi:YHS domain-containing protein
MGRKFNFFAWALGKSSSKAVDLRRFQILLGSLVALVIFIVIARWVFWSRSAHDHEVGPHGGIIVAINEDESHYHAEFVVDTDGRIRLFLSGEKPEQIVEVKPHTLIARAKTAGDPKVTSILLRPAEIMTATPQNTSQFWGRMSPELLGMHLRLEIKDLEIEGRKFAFVIEVPGAADPTRRSRVATDMERELVLKPGAGYTQADVEAAGGIIPSAKYKDVSPGHSMRAMRGDRLCPVSRIKADSRISWNVMGRTYQFCCSPCIVDFVSLAKKRPEEIVAPENLVSKE